LNEILALLCSRDPKDVGLFGIIAGHLGKDVMKADAVLEDLKPAPIESALVFVEIENEASDGGKVHFPLATAEGCWN
jgi:hypothetical protein